MFIKIFTFLIANLLAIAIDAFSFDLSVMTLNMAHSQFVPVRNIAGLIRAYSPDLVALQEVDYFTARSNYVNQPFELYNHTNMITRFSNTLYHEDGGQYGIVNMQSLSSNFVSFVFKLPSGNEEPRVMQMQVITIKKYPMKTFNIIFANTHLEAYNKEIRQAQMTYIFHLLSNYVKKQVRPFALLLAGDLNMQPDEIFALKNVTIWNWNNFMCNGKMGFGTWPSFPYPNQAIDYILYYNNSEMDAISLKVYLKECRIINEPIVSDHLAVLAKFSIQF